MSESEEKDQRKKVDKYTIVLQYQPALRGVNWLKSVCMLKATVTMAGRIHLLGIKLLLCRNSRDVIPREVLVWASGMRYLSSFPGAKYLLSNFMMRWG